jgi:flagellar basal body-associated protein FliL
MELRARVAASPDVVHTVASQERLWEGTMARILVLIMGGLLLVCVVCAGAGYFYFIPRAQDEIESNLQEAVATHVVPYFAGLDITPEAGTYVLSADDVNADIASANLSLENLKVEITPDLIALRFDDQNQDISYEANVIAVDGSFDVTNAQLEGVPGWLLPEDTITQAIEDSLNAYLTENGLIVTDVVLTDGEMTITTADA